MSGRNPCERAISGCRAGTGILSREGNEKLGYVYITIIYTYIYIYTLFAITDVYIVYTLMYILCLTGKFSLVVSGFC